MEKVELLLGALKELPEYEELLAAARDGKSAAVTGVNISRLWPLTYNSVMPRRPPVSL